jgi:hypothetical protein
MINRTTEVVVIDDEKDEVEPLLNLLNKQGVGLCYYRGNLRDLPEKPIVGVRLLFLDFVLGTDGQSDKNKISALMGVVKGIVARDNGPYVIFAWTKHNQPQDDLFGAFKKAIMNDKDFPKPVIIIDLEKNKCVNNLRLIRKRLKEVFNDKNILEVLFHWESNARTALRDVVKLLTEISRPAITQDESFDDYSSKWNAELEKHFCKIAEMTMGKKNIGKNRRTLIAAQLALTYPFHDCLERRVWADSEKFTNLISKIYTHSSKSHTTEERALLNTAFLLNCLELEKNLQPGNVYLLSDIHKNLKCKQKACYVNKARFTKNTIAGAFFNGDLNTYGRKRDLLKELVPVLIEVTPECDFVQNKWKCAKLIYGVLWPQEHENQLKSPQKTKTLFISSPVLVNLRNKNYCLAFNSHYLLTLDFSVFKNIAPVFRARKEFLVDIQHWFASHISRPGKSEF